MDQLLASVRPGDWFTVEMERFTPLWRWLSPFYLLHQIRAFRQVRALLRRVRPDVVVGFGGYLSAVGIFAACFEKIPSVIHEQNVVPGRANRLLARTADAVAISFPDTRLFLPAEARVEWTGNPVRFSNDPLDRATACAELGLDSARPVLLVMGGSQGSRCVNELSSQMWESVPSSERGRLQVLHLAGAQEAESVRETYQRLGVPAKVIPFLRDMRSAFSVAALVIARAGATGIAEMVSLAVPCVLIPYPHAGGHQRANALWMQEAGGAVMLEEKGLTPQKLWETVHPLLTEPERLERMQAALRARWNGSAVERLGAMVQKMAGA